MHPAQAAAVLAARPGRPFRVGSAPRMWIDASHGEIDKPPAALVTTDGPVARHVCMCAQSTHKTSSIVLSHIFLRHTIRYETRVWGERLVECRESMPRTRYSTDGTVGI